MVMEPQFIDRFFMNLRVKKILSSLQSNQLKLYRIKEKCFHPSYSIQFVTYPNLSARRICNQCTGIVEGITFIEKLKYYYQFLRKDFFNIKNW